MKNYYQTLGILPTATADQIKDAFKRQSKRVHPDVNWGDKYFEEIFKEVNEAYQVLSNPESRASYNQRFNHFFFQSTFTQPMQQAARGKASYHIHTSVKRKVIVNGCICFVLLFVFVTINASIFEKPGGLPGAGDQDINTMNTNVTPPPPIFTAVNASSIQEAELEDAGKSKLPVNDDEAVTKRPNTTEEIASEENAASLATVVKHEAARLWSKEEIIAMVNIIERERTKTGNTNKAVRIVVSESSNISNAFDLAAALQQKHYTIAGRQTITKTINGLQVNSTPDIITVSIGSM